MWRRGVENRTEERGGEEKEREKKERRRGENSGQNPRDGDQKQPDNKVQAVTSESRQRDREEKAQCGPGDPKGNAIPITGEAEFFQ